MIKQLINNGIKGKYKIKDIFEDNWDDFVDEMMAKGKHIRDSIIKNVKKIIGCQEPWNGFALYECPNCHKYKHVYFTCKSRFCNTCGAKYSKDRALAISAKLLDCSHRHVVFTIPQQLRKYFAHDRSLLNVLFQAASDTITYTFNRRNKSENYVPGMICVLHTFGRDLKWNPHIHMILCEEAIGKTLKWREFKHINYEGLRKSWQYCVLKLLLEKINDPSFKLLVDQLYKNHQNGFYVNSPPIKRFSVGVINYIVRYMGRPVLAQSRITNYDGDFVSFEYTPHDSNQLITETIPVFEFIKRLIIHIPEHGFKMLRYMGFYHNRHSKYKEYMKRSKRVGPRMYEALKKVNKNWRNRIMYYFRYDPLKCLCGTFMELVELFVSPRKIKFYSLYTSRFT